MALNADRQMQPETMLGQIEDVLREKPGGRAPAYTLILGAGASFGAVPTAKQMLGIAENDMVHPLCVPAWKAGLDPQSSPEELAACVREFWSNFEICNPGEVRLENGAPSNDSIPDAYRQIFNQKLSGGINTPEETREYFDALGKQAERPLSRNGTNFFLSNVLALQCRGAETAYSRKDLYVGERPFARTVFTTNFDSLLRTSLRMMGLLGSATDRSDQMAPDALPTDNHADMHIFHARGSVHRPFPADTDEEIERLKDEYAQALAPYFSDHGVIVLGYSGWDDCLLRALEKAASFKHNLYWLARGEASLSPRVQKFLSNRPKAFWVPIQDGGEFIYSLYCRLCPDMLQNEIATLVSKLKTSDPGIPAERQRSGQSGATASVGLPSVLKNFTPSASLEIAEHSSAIELPGALPEDIARTLVNRGLGYERSGKREEAISDYSRAIELPGVPPELIAWALAIRGKSYVQSGMREEAASDFSRAMGLPGALPEQIAQAKLLLLGLSKPEWERGSVIGFGPSEPRQQPEV